MTELTQEQLDLVRAYVARLKGEPLADERRYYYVEFNGFSTVVPSTECESRDKVFTFVMNEKLQAWYKIIGAEDFTLRIEEYSHDQYCDWLREKGM